MVGAEWRNGSPHDDTLSLLLINRGDELRPRHAVQMLHQIGAPPHLVEEVEQDLLLLLRHFAAFPSTASFSRNRAPFKISVRA
jgi:hypothetical protein